MPDSTPAPKSTGPDGFDALVIVGAALVLAAVVALAGSWWAVGLLGVLLALAGLFGGS